ncbi:hypothetical protein K461DRAFT_321028 [Myriangium duriaei CBS 260.36]|uniref:t-SNARE affecting a late Golgi compartment protein 1 n=1 Tax=Myriangium duriaei CBS 260.36 TaxID=1168546 RepID=A0A9P4J3E3_9PEZI|nr:hypothetical protein K461DRAFT_321028 [Myriangium duriaei CBS 260.36]
MAQSDDPFLQVQEDLLANLESARPLFQSYLRIRSSASSANNPELREARSELEHTLQDLSADLADLVESVKAVEKDPYRYGLEIEEVQRRRELCSEVGREVEDMHQELKNTVSDSKGKAASHDDALPHPNNFDSDEEEGQDGYGEFEQQRQMEIMAEQDEALEGVFKTVGNLRMQADTMGRELEEQAELLDSVDNIADRVGGKLQTGMKKIGYVIRKNEDTYSSCCIAVLIVALIILLVIVIAI